MDAMPMPDGAAMPMAAMPSAWIPMAGQTWTGAAASFLAVWVVMMLPMMLPALAPALWRYRGVVHTPGEGWQNPFAISARRILAAGLVAAAYFSVWASAGVVAFALGTAVAEALAAAQMLWPGATRAAPVAAGVAVVAAGAFQFTAWKARELARCRDLPARSSISPSGVAPPRMDLVTAIRHGGRLGLHCIRCCAGLTAILLVTGMMDIRVMAAIAIAITAERLAPAGWRAAWITGGVAVAVGIAMIGRAVGSG